MKLHSNLKWDTIFKRVEKQTGRKFRLEQDDSINWYDEDNQAWRFYGKAFLNTTYSKKSKQDFIDSL